MNKKTYFKILRAGTNTTIQDNGRNYLYHIGITVSGAIDQRNHKIANSLVHNKPDEATIEFAFQGPLLKLLNGKICFAITGDVFFNIIRKNSEIEEGKCYQNYILNHQDQIDIISSKKSVYGYLSINGGLEINKTWDSYSINTKAQIGPNNGKKYSNNQKIYINFSDPLINKKKKINYEKDFNDTIRVIRGTNFKYFSEEGQNNFFNQIYSVTNQIDRMGMRLKGPKIENTINTNIKSEGLVKGTIQVPADGNPIIMLSDHGTIGGYPKIGIVISADLDKVGQLTPGSKIKFKEVDLEEAEKLFKDYNKKTYKYLNEYN